MTGPALLLAAILVSAAEPSTDEEPDERRTAWQALFDRTAAGYKIYGDLGHRRRYRLREGPVYTWSGAEPESGVYGAVYVWSYAGCPQVVACLSRLANEKRVSLVHELHELSQAALAPTYIAPGATWKPKYGLGRQAFADAEVPASTALGRMLQMRRLAAAFAAHTEATDGEWRELSMLKEPIYHSTSTDQDVVDAALFAFVDSDAAPELVLLIEARRRLEGPQWQYALGRLSQLETFASYNGEQVWKSVRELDDTEHHNADQSYAVFHERLRKEPEILAKETVPTTGRKVTVRRGAR